MKEDKDKLTDKEEETLLLLWEYGPCTVKDLAAHYSSPQPHINTVSTFIRSLEAKGYVGHEQGRYGAFNYFAVKEKNDYKRSAVNRFVSRYFGNCFSMVSQLVDDRQIDADELKRLLDIVEKRQSHD